MRSLHVGINYVGTPYELKGCHNDVEALYIHSNLAIAMIDREDCELQPTRTNILRQLVNLITSDEEELFFSFSGHGGQIQDTNEDERDGQDEMILTCDQQIITDDEIFILLTLMKPNQRMFILMDCCHSGSVCDLPYTAFFRGKKMRWFQESKKGDKIPGHVMMISGCLDNQTSADAFIGNRFQGALTCMFIDTYKRGYRLDDVQSFMNELHNTMRRGNFLQVPMLSSNQMRTSYQLSIKGCFEAEHLGGKQQ